MMRNLFVAALLSAASVPAMASCDALQEQIDAKLQARGVKSYTLEIRPVPRAAKAPPSASGVAAAPQESGSKIVGTCDGGARQIIYTRR